jgi:salicylate hydroxylase
VAASGPIIIAGAGIGGLTAALALARRGLRVSVFDQAERLQETGAGIQLTPNASGILNSLGLGRRLEPHVVVPQELRVMDAPTGRPLATAELGGAAARRHGAPYWVIHRGDLQAQLLEAVRSEPDITLELATRVEEFAVHGNGVTVAGLRQTRPIKEHAKALVGADGLWSNLRRQIGHEASPRFAQHTAWRALVPAEAVEAELRRPAVNLWLGADTHLVHYPVKAGRLINVVAIVRDQWREPGWSEPGDRSEILRHFRPRAWHHQARGLLATADRWLKWALYDLAPLPYWSKGPVTLLGDAAHPMLPFLAQGAAMAIEDAAVLANMLGQMPDAPEAALRAYERARLSRTARVQRTARQNGRIYHMGGIEALLRGLALRTMGGAWLLSRYEWVYGWKPA